MKLELFSTVSKYAPAPNLIKIRSVGAEMYHADRQTDGRTDIHDEADSRSSQFGERE